MPRSRIGSKRRWGTKRGLVPSSTSGRVTPALLLDLLERSPEEAHEDDQRAGELTVPPAASFVGLHRRPASNHNCFYEKILLYVAAKASKYSNHTDTTSRRITYYGSICLYVYTCAHTESIAISGNKQRIVNTDVQSSAA